MKGGGEKVPPRDWYTVFARQPPKNLRPNLPPLLTIFDWFHLFLFKEDAGAPSQTGSPKLFLEGAAKKGFLRT